MKRFFLALLFVLSLASYSESTVLFQDNFDGCTTNCNAVSLSAPTPPSGWASWYGPASSTQGGTFHYSGEISTPDRHSSTGKNLKIWKYPGIWDGYNGALNYNAPANTSMMYMRYYLKIPTGMSIAAAAADTMKMWRWGTSAGETIYLNLLSTSAGDITRFASKLAINVGTWRDILSEVDTETLLWDGNWHCLEFKLDLANNDVVFWLDGVKKYENLSFGLTAGNFTLMQHWALGNTGSQWNHTGWLAMELDDLVIADTYVGPDSSPGYERLPVLILHGVDGSPTTPNVQTLISNLIDAGIPEDKIFTIDMSATNNSDLCSLNHVPVVRNRVNEVLQLTGATQVDVIGHSRGGLNLINYIWHDEGATKVRNFIGLAGALQACPTLYSGHPTDETPAPILYTSLWGENDTNGSDYDMTNIEGAVHIMMPGLTHSDMISSATIIPYVVDGLNGLGLNGSTAPVISNVSPSVVSSGQTVVISGSNLSAENSSSWNTQFKTGTAYGFEGTTPSSDGYTMGSGGTDPVYDSTRKLAGSKSLKAHVQGAWSGSSSPGSYLLVPSGVTTGERWLRAYVQFDLLGGSFPSVYQRIFTSQTTGQYHFGTTGSSSFTATWPVSGTPTSSYVTSPNGVLSEDRWYLVEARWKTSSPAAYDLYIDNALRLSGTNMSSSQITNILFPLVSWDGTTSAFSEDVYMDNFVVASSRIGPSSMVEISNSPTYHAGTYAYQEPLFISDSQVQIKADLSAIGSGPLFLWVTNNRGEVAGPYSISGSPSGDVTPPVTTAVPASGSYINTQTIALNCADNVACSSTQYCWGADCTPSITYGSPLAIQTNTLGYRSVDSSANLEAIKYSVYVSETSDTTPPTLSSLAPYGVLPFGTTSATLSIISSEGATCKYDATQQSYSSMAGTLTSSDGIRHSAVLSSLANGVSYNYYVSCQDAALNTSQTGSIAFSVSNTPPANSVLFSEPFDNNNYIARGWYDNTSHGVITPDGHNGSALQWTWAQGATTPTNGGAMRRTFEPTETIFVSFYIKFASGWRGSGVTYHPHMFHLLSDLDGAYSSLAGNYLDTYLEFLSDTTTPFAIRPSIALQDNLRVNTANGTPPNDLTAVTENRSVNYCNDPPSSDAVGACYSVNPPTNTLWYSASTWKSAINTVSEGIWHKIDVYLEMNTVSEGIGQSNGKMQFFVDGELAIDKSDVLYRTGQDATKKWAQLILAPYMSVGSPISQSVAIDDLVVAKTKNLQPTWPVGHVRFNAPVQVRINAPTQVTITQ